MTNSSAESRRYPGGVPKLSEISDKQFQAARQLNEYFRDSRILMTGQAATLDEERTDWNDAVYEVTLRPDQPV
jgi:hypothetical protein